MATRYSAHAVDLCFPPIPVRPSADAMEKFAPEVFELGDRYAAVTLNGDTDFDSELFFAVEAIMEGKNLAEVMACVSSSHPGAAEALKLLEAAHRRHWAS